MKYGFEITDIISIRLYVAPDSVDKSDYLLHTRTVILASNGLSFDSGWLY
jgi:hypothetical protein